MHWTTRYSGRGSTGRGADRRDTAWRRLGGRLALGALGFSLVVPTVTAQVAAAAPSAHGTSAANRAAPAARRSHVARRTSTLPRLSPVSSLRVTSTSASSVTLAWTRPTTNGFAGVEIRRSLGSTAASTPWGGELVARLSAATTSFSDDDLSPSTTFSYGVFSYGTGADSAPALVGATTKSGTVTTTDPCSASSSISSSRTWSPSSFTTYDVDCQLSIASGATLTIDAGTVVKLAANATLVVDSGGRLVAGGTGAPVTFTSSRDSEVGGTVEGPSPAVGDYTAAVELQTDSSASLTNSVFRFGNASVADDFYDAGCGTSGTESLSVTRSIVTSQVDIGNCPSRGEATFQVSANDFEIPATVQFAAISFTREASDDVSMTGNWFDFQGTTELTRAIWTEAPTGISLSGSTTNTFAPGSAPTLVGVAGGIPAGDTYGVTLPAGVELVLSEGSSFVTDGALVIGAGTVVGDVSSRTGVGLEVEKTGTLRLLGTTAAPVQLVEDSTTDVLGSGTLSVEHVDYSGSMSLSSSGLDVAEPSCEGGAEHVTIENSHLDAGIQLGQCATAGSEHLVVTNNVVTRPSGSQYLRFTSPVASPGALTVTGNRLNATSALAASPQPAIWIDSWPPQGISLAGSASNHLTPSGMNRVVEVADTPLPAPATWTIAPASGAVLAPWSGAGYPPGLLVSGTLDLEPGTVVKTVAGTGIQLEPHGTLDAVGTASARVTFTSIEDSSIDGDSNAGGSSVGIPSSKGGNYGLAVQSDEDTYLDLAYATFRDGLWALQPEYDVTPLFKGAATIAHCLFEEEVELGDFNGTQVGYRPVLVDNRWAFDGAPSGQFASGGGYDPSALQPAALLSNVNATGFSLAGATANEFTGTGAGRVLDLIGTSVPAGSSWVVDPSTGVVLSPTEDYDYLRNPGVTVAGHLALDPGTDVKVNGPVGIDVVGDGTIQATKDVFTAIADDAVAGDSNGDGSKSSPSPGVYAAAIELDDASGASTIALDRFSYAANAVTIPDGGNANVTHDTFTKNQTAVSAVAGVTSVIAITHDAFNGNTTSIDGESTWSTITVPPFHCEYVPEITATDDTYAGGLAPLVSTADYASIEAAVKVAGVKDSPSGWTKKIAPGATDDLAGWGVLGCVDVAVPKDSYTAVAIPLDLG